MMYTANLRNILVNRKSKCTLLITGFCHLSSWFYVVKNDLQGFNRNRCKTDTDRWNTLSAI